MQSWCRGEAHALLLLRMGCSGKPEWNMCTPESSEPDTPPNSLCGYGGAHSIWAPSCGSPKTYQRRTRQVQLGSKQSWGRCHTTCSLQLCSEEGLSHTLPSVRGRRSHLCSTQREETRCCLDNGIEFMQHANYFQTCKSPGNKGVFPNPFYLSIFFFFLREQRKCYTKPTCVNKKKVSRSLMISS